MFCEVLEEKFLHEIILKNSHYRMTVFKNIEFSVEILLLLIIQINRRIVS
jgi:hypothetical protein